MGAAPRSHPIRRPSRRPSHRRLLVVLVLLATLTVSSVGLSPASAQTTSPGALWLSPAELAALPTGGAAWETLVNRAQGDIGQANIADQDSSHDIDTLAVALVAARTGDAAYRSKATAKLLAVIGTENNHDPSCDYTPNRPRSLAIGRNLAAYVIAADLLGLRADGDPDSPGSRFQAWVQEIRTRKNCPNTGSGVFTPAIGDSISDAHDNSGSNGSAMAGGARIAAALYVGDTAEVERAWATFQRYSGNTGVGPDLNLSQGVASGWSHNPSAPTAINPAGTVKDGHRIDGAIINDLARGGNFAWPPGHTQYVWDGAAGYFLQAQLLHRAGYPAYTIQDAAPRRVIEFLRHLTDEFGDIWWDEHSDWVKYLANHAYNLNLPIHGPANGGKNLAWTDWTHGPGGPPGTNPPPPPDQDPPDPPDEGDKPPVDVSAEVDEAIRVSKEVFDDDGDGGRQAAFAIVTRGDVFADALAGAALADRGPVLYTAGVSTADRNPPLNEATHDEIDRILGGRGTVYLLGGSAAVSDRTAQQLDVAGYAVKRLSGPSRVETSVRVAEEVVGLHGQPSRVLLARSDKWPDAVTGGAYAAATGNPLVLTSTDSLHPVTKAFLDSVPAPRVALGGTAALSDATVSAAGATRVFGSERAGTAVAVAEQLWGRTAADDGDRYAIARGYDDRDWAYALAQAPWAAANDGPQLLVADQHVPPSVTDYLERLDYPGNDVEAKQFTATTVRSEIKRQINQLIGR